MNKKKKGRSEKPRKRRRTKKIRANKKWRRNLWM
jgi:hypothetical protein